MPREEDLPMVSDGFAKDVAGIPSFLIDPPAAAQRVHSKWFWVVPFLIASIAGIVITNMMVPFAQHAAEVSPPPDGVSAEQVATMTAKGMRIFSWLAPLTTGLLYVVEAGLLLGMASILGGRAKFGETFNLAAGCGLIQTLAGIAMITILHFKGEVNSMAELRPAMGLDILLPEGTNKMLMAAMGSFSVFSIWWVVMMALIFAAAFRLSKAKGFIAVLPLWFMGMLFSAVGAAFQK